MGEETEAWLGGFWMKFTAEGHRSPKISTFYCSPPVQCMHVATSPCSGAPAPWMSGKGPREQLPPYILSASCSRVPTRLMTCEAGWTASYSAKRWHTFSCDSVWFLATNPKILVGQGSPSEEWGPGRPGRGAQPIQPSSLPLSQPRGSSTS